ncbi:TetR family transcriptional regulator C-terminal domain-containing protein [Pontivivens insulae]|uniref:HTH-type transcriptional regulator RutR n=1 Tax=Pontivivens insulae TaxID=1639689 RepID=A0A2R8A6R1_9RHOB|nr:TetR family transcriptional regulator C-terminal domain-containing protein [Pontivivens insulae]RED17963.1 TetR family transcriptional regulator [Pontivivens insulae]SPF27852.1 HTH-type transcriptional regulator RutR [Pontivivens insulae]
MADGTPRKETRIQAEKREIIREAALEVFASHGFRGATLDQIAEVAKLSKPNLLYYFDSKEAIHADLLARLLDTWLDPLREMREDGDPIREIRGYIQRKLEAARDYPRESRLFANEILQGAPRLLDELQGPLRDLVNDKSDLMRRWMDDGKIARISPHHLIFAIWAVTQHYADFDVQVRAVLGKDDEARFHDAAETIEKLFFSGLAPR